MKQPVGNVMVSAEKQDLLHKKCSQKHSKYIYS